MPADGVSSVAIGTSDVLTSGCWYHWHCPQGCCPSQRIFLRLHSTQALLVDIRLEPDDRPDFPESLPSAGC